MNEAFDFPNILMLITTVSIIGGGFYFSGRVSRTLEELCKISKDHEHRIRSLERSRSLSTK